jgi:hypothetical protein
MYIVKVRVRVAPNLANIEGKKKRNHVSGSARPSDYYYSRRDYDGELSTVTTRNLVTNQFCRPYVSDHFVSPIETNIHV